EDGSHYTTSSSEFVTWTVSPEDSGVTVDENGVVDTSGVNVTGEETVNVTITATGHGPFDGVSKTIDLSITAPSIATLSGAACGGQLNDTDPENAKGACLKIATNDVGQWFTSTPSIAMMEALGYTQAGGSCDTYGGRCYSSTVTETGVDGPRGGVFATFTQDAINGGTGQSGQVYRYCQDLSAMTFAGKSDWRRPTLNELKSLYSDNGNMWTGFGWPAFQVYWSSTPSTSTTWWSWALRPGVANDAGHYNSYRNASCVSGS
ncbi:DUF1566 domain-containing protein, partial [Vibrio navarrensis]